MIAYRVDPRSPWPIFLNFEEYIVGRVQRHGVLFSNAFTYYLYVTVILAIDDALLARARRRAESMGTSVDQLILEYLEQLAAGGDPGADAAEFEHLSRKAEDNSRGWKFNRDELHERR